MEGKAVSSFGAARATAEKKSRLACHEPSQTGTAVKQRLEAFGAAKQLAHILARDLQTDVARCVLVHRVVEDRHEAVALRWREHVL
eukprot:3669672-Prymnesium_polylepis.1